MDNFKTFVVYVNPHEDLFIVYCVVYYCVVLVASESCDSFLNTELTLVH